MKATFLLLAVACIVGDSIGAPVDQVSLLDQGEVHTISTIRDVLKDNEIIPDVLDDFEPSYILDIVYPATKHHDASPVDLGNDLLVKSVSHRPIFTFKNISHPSELEKDKESSIFTLILTDPDALSRDHPVKSEMCHWIYTNISLSSTTELVVPELISGLTTSKKDKHGNELEPYYPPAPPPKTGPHRYVFVLLKGSADHPAQRPKERPHWGYGKQRHGVRDWAHENDLEVVGANFFFASNKKQ